VFIYGLTDRNSSLAKQGVQSILNIYKLISKLEKNEKNENAEDVSSAEKWESDDDDRMDNDDLFNVDEENEVQTESDIEDEYLSSEDDAITLSNNKRKPCPSLKSRSICKYISRTPVQFDGTRRIEIVAKELFPNLFPNKFTHKRLTHSQKHRLNRQLYSEAIWRVDRDCKLKCYLFYIICIYTY
jgi:hypothetical protein